MIKIPKQYYVGIRGAAHDSIPLAFATPFGTDAAFTKRKSTVDKWVGVRHGARFETYDNVLLEGFRISQSVRRYGWNGGNVVWRIEDPRGFELEISSSNFASIVDCCVIDKGVIAGKCIWGRDGAANILLPESSEPYCEAIKFTKLSQKTVEKSGLALGRFVRLKDDSIAVYCGSYHGFGVEIETETHYGGYTHNFSMRQMSYGYELTPQMLPKRHVFLREENARKVTADGKFDIVGLFAYSDTKVVAELLDETMVVDPQVIEDAAINSPQGYSLLFPKTPSAVSTKAFKTVEFKVVDGATPGSIRMYEDPNGQLHFVSWNNFHEGHHPGYPPKPDRKLFVNTCPIDINELKLKGVYKRKTDQINGVAADYFKMWKPKTLIAVLDGGLEAPVRCYRYTHEDGRPMTETSVYPRPW